MSDNQIVPDAPKNAVHNHGTEDGPGLACPEQRTDGKLWGKCMGEQVAASEKAMHEVDAALERYIIGERTEIRALNDIARIVGAYNVERIGDAK